MTRASTPPILLELQSADSLSSQASALRTLKNETIGHDQRKEAWIRWGIIPILAKVLASRQTSGKNTELNGPTKSQQPSSRNPEEDETCLQAIIILGSIAQGISLKPGVLSVALAQELMTIINQAVRLSFPRSFLAASSRSSCLYCHLPIALNLSFSLYCEP